MARLLPRDPLLVGRLGACAGGAAWLGLGGQGIVPIALAALALLVTTSAALWRLDLRRGGPLLPSETPTIIVLADLVAAGIWMVGSSTNPRSIAFVIVLGVGAFAMYRLGRAGILATMVAYLAARLVMESIRVALGDPTPVTQLVAEVMVVSLTVLILAATVDSYRAEQGRAERALRIGRSLERIATEIAGETEPMALFRSIARNALHLADAQHATVNIRRGEEFHIAAGAGTASASSASTRRATAASSGPFSVAAPRSPPTTTGRIPPRSPRSRRSASARSSAYPSSSTATSPRRSPSGGWSSARSTAMTSAHSKDSPRMPRSRSATPGSSIRVGASRASRTS